MNNTQTPNGRFGAIAWVEIEFNLVFDKEMTVQADWDPRRT